MNLQRQANELGVLNMFRFDIVHGCQLACVGCPNSTLKDKIQKISIEDFRICMNNLDVELIERFCLFNYGEALLHHDLPGIFNVLKEIENKFNFLEISTNAQFARWDQITEIFKTKMLNRLVVSCDGDGTSEQYERMRPPARWEKLIEFLTKANELRRRYHCELELMTRTIVFRKEDRARWNEILQPLGWKPYFLPWWRLPDASEDLSKQEVVVGSGVCHFLREEISIVDCDGTVVPCCGHPRAGVFGNLKKQNWSEIHYGDKRRNFIDTLKNSRESLPFCAKCEFGHEICITDRTEQWIRQQAKTTT